ncbi:hypothetical protein GCM10009682_62920 [Luedemannella flava]|uniref:Nickel/cobalt efflux system n=1 Tax=Luedemannella flava TaxID=349316 RepID=A0ABN2MRM5_9ACTN
MIRSLSLAVAAGVLAVLLLPAGAAGAAPPLAHPLGNFSVNESVALTLRPDRVDAVAVVDLAELPTLADRATADTTGAATCAAFADALAVTVAGERLGWTVSGARFAYLPGAAGLATSRVDCAFTAPARLGDAADVTIDNGYLADRVGWRELAAAGAGVRLGGSSLPAASPTNGLRDYPRDLLDSPADVRTATLRVEPGDGAEAPATGAGSGALPVGATERTGGWTAGAERLLDRLVAAGRLTPLVGLLAVGLALLLGAAHAALPGHGKTVMAAYLAGRDGRPRDAVAVGATVTLTHTGGVLVLGLVLTSVTGLFGVRVLGALGIVSGALIVVVGAALLRRALRATRTHIPDHAHDHGDTHDADHGRHNHGHHHGQGHARGHDHGRAHDHRHHGHDHDHSHVHRHGHHHGHGTRRGRADRWSILGLGVAGGLVPSPSALIVLLGAVGLGRTAFGVALVLAYGLGMAATLTAAGLLLLRLRGRWLDRPTPLITRIRRLLPTTTAGLVLLVGVTLAARAAAMMP